MNLIQLIRRSFCVAALPDAADDRRAMSPRVVLTDGCLDAVARGLSATSERGHEGIVYLVGLVNIQATLAVTAYAPQSQTTIGSVEVAALDMAAVVRRASNAGLQVVGQVHTHPEAAYHSRGDLAGMRIRYPGYVSLVLPHYGRLLPSLGDAHVLIWDGARFFEPERAPFIFDSRDGL